MGSTQNYVTLTLLRNIPLLMPNERIILELFPELTYIISVLYNISKEIELLYALVEVVLTKMTKVEQLK